MVQGWLDTVIRLLLLTDSYRPWRRLLFCFPHFIIDGRVRRALARTRRSAISSKQRFLPPPMVGLNRVQVGMCTGNYHIGMRTVSNSVFPIKILSDSALSAAPPCHVLIPLVDESKEVL